MDMRLIAGKSWGRESIRARVAGGREDFSSRLSISETVSSVVGMLPVSRYQNMPSGIGTEFLCGSFSTSSVRGTPRIRGPCTGSISEVKEFRTGTPRRPPRMCEMFKSAILVVLLFRLFTVVRTEGILSESCWNSLGHVICDINMNPLTKYFCR